MYGIKVLLKTFVTALVLCALVLVWYDEPACGTFIAKCVASLFIIIAVIASKEISHYEQEI